MMSAPTKVVFPSPRLNAGERLAVSGYTRGQVADYGNARAAERDEIHAALVQPPEAPAGWKLVPTDHDVLGGSGEWARMCLAAGRALRDHGFNSNEMVAAADQGEWNSSNLVRQIVAAVRKSPAVEATAPQVPSEAARLPIGWICERTALVKLQDRLDELGLHPHKRKVVRDWIEEAISNTESQAQAAIADAALDRCEHGIRRPHECRECADAEPAARLVGGEAPNLPAYGQIPWDRLVAAVGSARGATWTPDPKFFVGHDMPGINMNSLNRIVSGFVNEKLAATQAAATDAVGEQPHAGSVAEAFWNGTLSERNKP